MEDQDNIESPNQKLEFPFSIEPLTSDTQSELLKHFTGKFSFVYRLLSNIYSFLVDILNFRPKQRFGFSWTEKILPSRIIC